MRTLLPAALFGIVLALAIKEVSAAEPGPCGCDCPLPPSLGPIPVPPQTPAPPPATQTPNTPAAQTPVTPSAEPRPTEQQPQPDQAQAPTNDLSLDQRFAGVGGETTSAPNMIGDLGGFCAMQVITVPVTQVSTVSSTQTVATTIFGDGLQRTSTQTFRTTQVNVSQAIVKTTVCTPYPGPAGSGFKISDNESPEPTTRLFVTWNDFQSLTGVGGVTPPSSSSGTELVRTVVFNPRTGVQVTTTQLVTTNTTLPGLLVPAPSMNLDRETFGWEQALFDSRASIGLRLPIFQTHAQGSDAAVVGDDFGDLTVVAKYALLRDPASGSVLSAGLAVTAPTGPGVDTVAGTIHPVLWQPFVGYIWNRRGLFIEGFSSVLVPDDSRDVTVLFNDVGVGYVLARRGASFVRFLAPVLETHVTTPLDHRGGDALIDVPDLVDLTGGVHIGLGGRSVLTAGVVTPVTGPRVFDVEAVVQLNYRW